MRAFDLRARCAAIIALLLSSSRRPRIHDGHERELATVVREHRRSRAARKVREALSLAARGEVERVELRNVVAVALRAEDDAAAVRTPDDAAFRAARGCEAAARVARAGVDEPQVAELVLSSYEGSVTCTTIQRPSGLTCGGPTRFMSQMSSCVGTTLAAAAASGTCEPPKQQHCQHRAPSRKSADAFHGTHGSATHPCLFITCRTWATRRDYAP